MAHAPLPHYGSGRWIRANTEPWKTRSMKTRTLLVLAVITGLLIIVAFAVQVLVDGRFLG